MTVDGAVGKVVGQLAARLDYPMVIVTAAADGDRSGCLVGFSTQCSVDPPRFLVCISDRNATHRVATRASLIGVHFLTEADRELSELFGEQTTDTVDKFAHCDWEAGPDGLPLLTTGGGRLVGRVLGRHEVGDHTALLVEPVEAAPGTGGRQLGFQAVKDMEPGHKP